MKRYQKIVELAECITRCKEHNNVEWLPKWEARLAEIMDTAPSGSGIDNGTVLLRADQKSIEFSCDFHHMSEHGYYDGWTEHTIKVTPAFDGVNMRITGRDRNQIKEYLAEIVGFWLDEQED